MAPSSASRLGRPDGSGPDGGEARADAAQQGDPVCPELGHALQQHAELGTGLIQQGGGEIVPVARGIEHPGAKRP